MLPVGGIREKVLAANRIGIKTILIPEKNIKDLVELPEQVRKCFGDNSSQPHGSGYLSYFWN